MEHRLETLVIVGAGLLQVGLGLAGLPGWACPIKSTTGIPCPGCGLTAATELLLHGQWRASLQTHLFAPIFLIGFIILTVGVLSPEKPRRRLIAAIANLEQRTGLVAWVLLCLLIYWGFRLVHIIS